MSYIDKAMDELARTLVAKNADYKIDGEFSNFEFVTDITGVHPEVVMLTQIAIKLGRLKGLPDDPQNESRLDTIKDLAGYAVILYAYALSLQPVNEWTEWRTKPEDQTDLLEGYDPHAE